MCKYNKTAIIRYSLRDTSYSGVAITVYKYIMIKDSRLRTVQIHKLISESKFKTEMYPTLQIPFARNFS